MKTIEGFLRRVSWTTVAMLAATSLVMAVGCGDSGGGGEGGEDGGTDVVGDTSDGGDGAGGDTTEGDTTEGDTDTTGGGDTTDDGDAGGGGDTEDCVNGIDDDGDNLIDCFDIIDCGANPACIENCTDGIDSNGDNLIDCDDPQCFNDEACSVASCGDYFDCRVQEGCNCQLGVDCPTDDDAVSQCAANCQANPTCDQQCFSEMEPEFQQYWTEFVDCVIANCANLENPAYTECLFDSCLDELVNCFQVGEEERCDYYFECAGSCPSGDAGQDCRGECINDLNGDAYKDLVEWDTCRFDRCDTDDDGTADSTACFYMASFLSCGNPDDSGTCLDLGVEGGTGCGALIDCWAACENLEDTACIDACLSAASADAYEGSKAVADCVITSCGAMEEELTSACFQAALTGACAAEYAECSGGTPAEDCDNEADDDGDGDVDCDDADCAADPACAPTTADTRVLHLSPDGPGVDIFVNGVLSPITNLMFGMGTPYVTLGAAAYDFAVAATGSPIEEAVLTVDDYMLEAGKSYTLVAYDLVESIKVLALTDNRSKDVAEGTINVRAVHTAVGVGEVDIYGLIDPANPTPLVQDLEFGEASDYLTVPAGQYNVGIDTNNDIATMEVQFSLPELASGMVTTVYAVQSGGVVSLRAQLENGDVVTINPNE